MTTVLDRGGKHICSSCATRFYDLGKTPAACPQCRHLVPVVKAPVRRKRRSAGDGPPQETTIVTEAKPKPVKWKTGYSG